MATFINFVRDIWDARDPKVQDYFLARHTIIPFTIIVYFTYFIFKSGPKMMENRKPFNLKKIIIAYNISQVVINAWLFSKFVKISLQMKFACEPIDYSTSPKGMEIFSLCYYYYLIKIYDLLDTVFFLLRKKNGHISFLHLYHHLGMIFLAWVGVSWYGGGHSIHIGTFNCMVHTVMYFYYLLTILGYPIKNNITIKKSITILQLFHHIYLETTLIYSLFVPDCQYPRLPIYVLIPNGLLLISLFINFYIQTYIVKKNQTLKDK